MSQPLVSIVVPTHNRKDMVIRLLNSILTGTYKNVEIIVVDDASTDGTEDALRDVFKGIHKIRIVRNISNLHAAASRNAGTRISKGKYIFYIDDDNVLHKNAVSELVRVFEENEKIGELGLVNMSFRDKKKVLWLVTMRNMCTSKTYLPVDLQEYSKNAMWDTVDVPNAFMMRSSVIIKYGISFCEKFGIMYEESDPAYRIRKVGYSIKVVRDAIIYHDVGDYLSHFINDGRRFFVFARNRIIFHSLYSTKIQLLCLLSVWIWIFMLYYWYKIISYTGDRNFSLFRKISLMFQYLQGNIAGLYFVFSKEKLVYPKVI